MSNPSNSNNKIKINSFFRVLILVLSSLLVLGSLLLPIALRPSKYSVEIGQISTQEIFAPRTLTYTSDFLTEQARIQAENSIQDIYLAPDQNITRTQITDYEILLSKIESIRNDGLLDYSGKIQAIQSLEPSSISDQQAKFILNLIDATWIPIKNESLRVLEFTLRTAIQESQLKNVRINVINDISYSFSDDQRNLIDALVQPFIVPTSLLSPEATALAKEEARNNVKLIPQTYISGETIVQRGQKISPIILEALQKYGLIEIDRNNQDIIATITLVMLLTGFVHIYFSRRRMRVAENIYSLLIIACTFLIFLYGARFFIPNRTLAQYLFPIPAFGLIVASLFNLEIGMIFSMLLGILAAYGLQNGLELTLYYMLGSIFGILILGKARRIIHFVWSGLIIGLAGSAVIIAFRLPNAITDWVGIASLIAASGFCGLASSSLALLFHFVISQSMGIITPLRLIDILRSDHPLLKLLLHDTPGTYQHSLMVANLSERAADAIGADALLSRVGALFHDIGKISNSSYFIENQIPGQPNPHDRLDPKKSAKLIIGHVFEGVQQAKRYRLPVRVIDFITEHHGTLITRYQYGKALESQIKITPDDFRYPGPKPKSKETAILMLADSCEAKARAELPKDENELSGLVHRIIEYCEKEGQLVDSDLTFNNLSKIEEAFIFTLKNSYHPRLRYPDIEMLEKSRKKSRIKFISK